MRNKVLIVGASRLGAGIAKVMTEHGENVLIIDSDERAFDKLPLSFSGYTIVGDATNLSVLEENDLSSLKKIIITTDKDNVNLFIALASYHIYHIPEVFVRLADNDKRKLLEGTSIKAIYPYELSIEKFLDMNKEEF